MFLFLLYCIIGLELKTDVMKKVLIIGAHGKVGRILTRKLKAASDFTPVALFRKEEQKELFEEMGVEYSIVSLEEDIGQIAEAMAGMDAVVFTAGSGGKTGPDKTLAVDLDGAVKSMEAAIMAKVRRYVMVSALNAGNRDAWKTSKIKPYYIAKHYADRILRSIGLDDTIVRPGRLQDEPGTGKIDITEPVSKKGVPREDVASLIVELLRHDNTIGKVIEFNGGDEPVEEAAGRI